MTLAHIDRRSRPSPGVVLDDTVYAHLRDGATGWDIDDNRPLSPATSLLSAHQLFNHACITDEYLDTHCWVFVPSSFSLIVSTLHVLGKTRLALKHFELGGSEFLAVLNDAAHPEMMSLGELAAAAQREERQAMIDTLTGERA